MEAALRANGLTPRGEAWVIRMLDEEPRRPNTVHMQGDPRGADSTKTWAVAVAAVAVTLVLIAGGIGGYLLGTDSGRDLKAARSAGTADGRLDAAAELSPRKRRAAKRQGLKSGYSLAYKRALKTTEAKVAAGGPHNCGDSKTSASPFVSKVRAEGVGCATALEFASGAKSCNLDGPCQGYTCSSVATGYEEGETTCRRDAITIRFLSGV